MKLLKNDSVIVGFLRHYVSAKDGQRGLEVWRTKDDYAPMCFPKNSLIEYAINKDTFRILGNFKPFEDQDTYYDLVEAIFLSKGKINLFLLRYNPDPPGIPNGAPMISKNTDDQRKIYVLENNATGYRKAISDDTDKMNEQLLDFFTESYLRKYEQYKKRITYKNIPDMVKLYNSK